jgi:hypothetical protein
VLAFVTGIGLTFFTFLLNEGVLSAEPVPVRHLEGTVHGLLCVRTPRGVVLGTGDLTQVPEGDRITSRLAFRFTEGSIEEETTTYSQQNVFRLISDHFVQKGPLFRHPIDMSIETATGNVTVRFIDNEGTYRVATDHFDLPPDLANGLIPVLVKNIRLDAQVTKVSFLMPRPKPMLVKLALSSDGQERFSLEGSYQKATRIIIKVELEEQPPDSYVWILAGEAPTFLKWRAPAYEDGPIWVTQVASPVWSDQ